jgi:type IV secretory pathway VirD2 relaxase
MSNYDTCDFRLRPGRVRNDGGPDTEFRLFAREVRVAIAKAGGTPHRPLQPRSQQPSNTVRMRPRKGRCCRIGRGQAAADRLKFMAGMRGSGDQMRRVIVRARIVKLKLGGSAVYKHLRYLQRDGTSRGGERGRLYGAEADEVDSKTFIKRGRQDRRQFRFIVAPEHGERLTDLRAFTRDVMRQMEKDLGTKLDWIAVNHFNTGHPHIHVMVRGRDDLGKDLIIAGDYITDGMMLRARELATLELGPLSDRELRSKLRAEISAERFTDIDRAMIAEAKERLLDLRPEDGQVRANFDKTLRVGRLQVLARYGLAHEIEPGVWTLSDDLEPTMRELGDRAGIVKAMSRALAERGQQRGLETYDVNGEENPVVGRLIDKRPTNGLGRRIGVVVDAIDGRVHHLMLHDTSTAEEAPIGAIVEVERVSSQRPVDRNIAQIAGDTGEYRPSDHRAPSEVANPRVPGDDCDASINAHVRRLEALRRAGIAARADPDHWLIPNDFEDRAVVDDVARGRQASMRMLCAYDLDRQVTSDGATWLDRELLSGGHSRLSMSGFGAETREALERRKAELVRQGHVWRAADGRVRLRSDLLGTLQRQELERTGRELAAKHGRAFQAISDGQTVRGTLVGSAQLVSGRFAMIDDGVGFSLVPWRRSIDNKIGCQVIGVIRGGDITWQFGRGRGPGFAL